MTSPATTPQVIVRPHPRGGWTHAVRGPGTVRFYFGWWPTKRQAQAFAPKSGGAR